MLELILLERLKLLNKIVKANTSKIALRKKRTILLSVAFLQQPSLLMAMGETITSHREKSLSTKFQGISSFYCCQRRIKGVLR